MEFREAIDQAVERLTAPHSPYNSTLNRTGHVRVPLLVPVPASLQPPEAGMSPDVEFGEFSIVEFSIMDHVTGKRLVAEYKGRSEFVA